MPGAGAHHHRLGDAAHQQVADADRQLSPRGVHREPLLLGEGAQHGLEVAAQVGARPDRDGVLSQALAGVRDEQFRIDLQPGAQPGAVRAGSPGGVEGELPGLELLDRDVVAVRAGQRLGVAALAVRIVLRPVDEVDRHHPGGQPERGLHRVGQPLLDGRLHGQPIDDDVDRVLLLLVERGRGGELVHLAVHPDAAEPLPGQLPEEVDVLALAAAHHRRQHLEAGALRQGEQPVDDLLRALPADRLAAFGAVRVTDPGVEQPQVVVDLGDRAHRRTRVAAGRLLVDRDRRREPLDEVDIRLVHLAQELPGVGGQALDVAALPLGEDGVKGEARLTRTGEPGEDDEGVTRKVEADVAQVVLPGATHDEAVIHAAHRMSGLRQFLHRPPDA